MSPRERVLTTYRLVRELGIRFDGAERDLLTRFESGFGVAVVGLLKRGKSTLVNALVGVPLSSFAREPETLWPVNIESGLWSAWYDTSAGRSGSLPDTPEQFRLAIGRKAGSLPSDTISVHVRCPSRLPAGLRLIDTPGVNEIDREDLDLIWRSSGAAAAVLVSSVPPGVSRDDLALLEVMRAHFKDDLVVVLKSVDSGVSEDDLLEAAAVWQDAGVTPILLADSREVSESTWGNGRYREIERAIQGLSRATSRKSVSTRGEVEGILTRAVQVFLTDQRRSQQSIHLPIYRAAFVAPLLPEVNRLFRTAAVETYDRCFRVESETFLDLMVAAHQGSKPAQSEIRKRWRRRIGEGEQSSKDKSLAPSVGLRESLAASLSQPDYSRFDAAGAIELSIEDLTELSSHVAGIGTSWDRLTAVVDRAVDRISRPADYVSVMKATLPDNHKARALSRLMSMACHDVKTRKLGLRSHLDGAKLRTQSWSQIGPESIRAIRSGILQFLAELNEIERQLRDLTAETANKPHVADSVVSIREGVTFIEQFVQWLTPDLRTRIDTLRHSVDSPRGLVKWVEYVQGWKARYVRDNVSSARRALAFAAVCAVALLVAFNAGLVGMFVVSLVATGFFGFRSSRDEVSTLREMPHEEFSSGHSLKSGQRRSLTIDIAAFTVAVAVTVSALATVDLPQLQERSKRSDSALSDSSQFQPDTMSGTEREPVTTTISVTPTAAPVMFEGELEISDAFGGRCGSAFLTRDGQDGAFSAVSDSEAVTMLETWRRGAVDVVLLACHPEYLVVTVATNSTGVELRDFRVTDLNHFSKISSSQVRLGTTSRCCFPDVPLDYAELWSIGAAGAISSSAPTYLRYPLWDVDRSRCQRYVGGTYFEPESLSGSAFGQWSEYVTLCSRGPLVERLQQILADEGYAVAVDGYLGSTTFEAFLQFAANNGSSQADGVVETYDGLYFARTSGRS